MSSSERTRLSDANLFDMIETLGMEPAGAPVPRFGHMIASAVHACTACPSVHECRAWLTAAEHRISKAAPEFCLEKELLAEFLLEPLMHKAH